MNDDNMDSSEAPVSNVIKIDESKVRGHLDRIVRSTIEQTINDLL